MCGGITQPEPQEETQVKAVLAPVFPQRQISRNTQQNSNNSRFIQGIEVIKGTIVDVTHVCEAGTEPAQRRATDTSAAAPFPFIPFPEPQGTGSPFV